MAMLAKLLALAVAGFLFYGCGMLFAYGPGLMHFVGVIGMFWVGCIVCKILGEDHAS